MLVSLIIMSESHFFLQKKRGLHDLNTKNVRDRKECEGEGFGCHYKEGTAT